MNLNKTMIIGRVGKDPESSNGAVKFSVAAFMIAKFDKDEKDGSKK